MIKKASLKPLERKAEDENIFLGNLYAYYTYHQRRGHPINSCKALKEDILDLIAQRKYEIKENASYPDHVVNAISVNEDICVTLKRGHLRSNPNQNQNLVTYEHVSLPTNTKAYSMIEQLKTNPAKISLYDLISTSKKYREVLYVLFKK